MTSTAEQLEYHGLYLILIATMLLIVVALAIAAVLETREQRQGKRDRRR